MAVEAGVGLAVAGGLALRGVLGYALAGAGVVVVVGALLRRRGEWADRRLLARLRRGRLAVTPPQGVRPAAALGVAQTLLPALTVTEVADRNVPGPAGLGVVSDGRGHATVAALPGGVLPDLPAGIVARWLAEDPARPAAAQLVVEQFAVPSWDLHHRFQPTVAYRQLDRGGRPVAVRSWLVVRHEPLDAPEAAARRGGGEDGARAAAAACAARLRARLAAHGAETTPLGAPAARELLRQLGDPDTQGRSLPWIWASGTATHSTLSVRVSSQRDWHRLLSGLADCAADRVVVAATLTADGPDLRVQTAVRVVSPLAQHAAAQRDRLRAAGVTGAPVVDQAAGLLATLPLAYPARPLDEATGLASLGVRLPRGGR
ncbi:type VII secretion protein EccE [Streptomyces sp. 4N509B]|uniref:type VII secretion protein EccE n=1 Tax=Streptomyces sp. 4N509B TaxID=3457413 RepID=UPI003FD2A625